MIQSVMPYKKRRVQKNPNKNLKKIQRHQFEENNLSRAGTLSSRYSNVGQVRIDLEFVSSAGHSLGQEKRVYSPADNLNVLVDCQGRCGNGRVNIDELLANTINTLQPQREITHICQEVIHAGANDMCQCELRCKISITYL